jgi:hypothetical protein
MAVVILVVSEADVSWLITSCWKLAKEGSFGRAAERIGTHLKCVLWIEIARKTTDLLLLLRKNK